MSRYEFREFTGHKTGIQLQDWLNTNQPKNYVVVWAHLNGGVYIMAEFKDKVKVDGRVVSDPNRIDSDTRLKSITIKRNDQ